MKRKAQPESGPVRPGFVPGCSPSRVRTANHGGCRGADGQNIAAEAFKGQKCQGKASQSQILKLIYTSTLSLALAQAVIRANESQRIWKYSVIFARGETPFSLRFCSPFPTPWVSNTVSALRVLTRSTNYQFNCHMRCSSRKKLLLVKGVKVSHV